MKKNHFGLIMACGQGTRFWPWSSEKKPKQFLSIIGKEPLITQTFNRLKKFIKADNIFVVADNKYLELTMESIPGFKESNFISEPCPRNTAPCLILSNIVLSRINPEANVAVVPADHYIPDTDIYANQIKDALNFADNKCMVTSGIKPSQPHTGYGYIQFNPKNPSALGKTSFFDVIQFKEKPKLPKAKTYLADGNFYWNSGMFFYKLNHFKEFLKTYAPYYSQQYEKLHHAYSNKRKFMDIFKSIEPDSIDFALMEKVKDVKMFKAKFRWSDVGAWSSLYELNPKKDKKNVSLRKNNIFIDSENSLIFSTEDKPIAVIGMQNVAVINTGNGILISDLDNLQKVKDVTQKLKK